MKGFIEWLEKDTARTRKVILLSTVFVFLIIATLLFIIPMFTNFVLTEHYISLFMIFTGLITSIYGFYTGTSSDKSTILTDKASEVLINKLDSINDNINNKRKEEENDNI